MKKTEVISSLKKLSSRLKDKKYITEKDVRSVPKLSYYIYVHFRTLGNALREANLPSSRLASSMSISNENLLSYLKDFKKELGHPPRAWDIENDEKIYKKYSNQKFSWGIFKTRFGGLVKARELSEKKSVKGDKDKKTPVTKRRDDKDIKYFEQKKRFWGEAAELHVTAELLYLGFQAANIPVDEGLDILAVKDKKTFYFQIKHKDLGNNQPIKLTKSSYEKTGAGDVYFIFVLLSEKKRQFLIVPYHIVNDWIRAGLVKETEKHYLIDIKEKDGKFELGEKSLEKYRERWEDIR